MKKASFSVEAAYIVPLMLVFITFLMGYTYFTHQLNWSKGAAYESIYYALQRNIGDTDPSEEAENRLHERIDEMPLDVSEISAGVKNGSGMLSAETGTTILPEAFGDMFVLNQTVSAADIDPVRIKKAEWLIKYVSEKFGQ